MSLAKLADDSIDLVLSGEAMQHIKDSSLANVVNDLMRILKPGGYISQQIAPSDHLCIYAKGAHRKCYLQYGDKEWKLAFANDVLSENSSQMPASRLWLTKSLVVAI